MGTQRTAYEITVNVFDSLDFYVSKTDEVLATSSWT